MAYEKTIWTDHIVEQPNRYKQTANGDGTINLERQPGSVIQAGTPLSAANLNRIEEGIEAAHNMLADTGYQVATVEGSQIQLVKKSDSEVLKFKLDTTIEGPVTISLDGGVTELPVQDLDGVQLTSLEKGFIEVVANATFFTLSVKSGGISSAELTQAREYINAMVNL